MSRRSDLVIIDNAQYALDHQVGHLPIDDGSDDCGNPDECVRCAIERALMLARRLVRARRAKPPGDTP